MSFPAFAPFSPMNSHFKAMLDEENEDVLVSPLRPASGSANRTRARTDHEQDQTSLVASTNDGTLAGSHKKSRVDASKSPEYEASTVYQTTRERVVRAEEERRGAELAGAMVGTVKEKTGYQLYHMHRVAEIKEEAGVKHHEAFKRAAKDWSRLPNEEKEWYNDRADKKPMAKQSFKATVIYEHLAVDEALEHIMQQIDVHESPEALPQPVLVLGSNVESMLINHVPTDAFDNAKADAKANANAESLAQEVNEDSCNWACTLCGNADAGAPDGACLMCAAFGHVTF